MDSLIVAKNVTKRFGLSTSHAGDLRELLSKRPTKSVQPATSFLALDDVSFTVKPGHPVGIIGHNGSGKSTLLKLLTGILQPTSGTISVKGRIGALIEVGAGFHPDLSGRENVFLSGSIQGLTRKQVEERYDRIVEFAGLAPFMETPVKRYSSGMYMRLGFAIVAHLDPEILLIDEVLAVGDALFQNKCLHFLREFVKRGGTVVFVSHVMGQVEQLCETCVWLDYGKARFIGKTEDAVKQYYTVVAEREDAEFRRLYPVEWEAREAEKQRAREEAAAEAERQRLAQREAEALALQTQHEHLALQQQREAEEAARHQAWLADPNRGRFTGLRLFGDDGTPRTSFSVGEAIRFEIDFNFPQPLPKPAFCVEFFREDGVHAFTTSNFDHNLPIQTSSGTGTVSFRTSFLALNAGRYRIQLRLFRDWQEDDWEAVLEDSVAEQLWITVDAGRFGHGMVFLPIEWSQDVR